MEKRFTIECNEKQLHMIDSACELECRMRNGQLLIGEFQDLLEEAWLRSHPGEKIGSDAWWEMRGALEQRLIEFQKDYFGLNFPGASYGLGHDSYSDTLWDIHKSCEHARYLALPESEREQMRWSVMADPPMQFGKEPLMTIKEK